MPHISKHTLNQEIKRDLHKQLIAIIKDSGRENRLQILQELLTKTELTMLAKRLGVLMLFEKGFSTHDIGRLLGMSPSTVARFELAADTGKYRHTKEWVGRNKTNVKVEKLLETFFKLALQGRTRSLKKIIDEM